MSKPELTVGQHVELSIQSVAFGGKGLARLDDLVIFVPFTAVGDKVSAKISTLKSSYAEAQLHKVITPGPNRETPLCAYYQECGGCQYQHLTYEEELAVKTRQIHETFKRIAQLSEIPLKPIIASPQPYGYRNRITVHAEKNKIGFRGVDPTRLVDIKQCVISSSEVNQKLAELRARKPKPGHYSIREANLPPSGFYQSNQLLLEPFRKIVTEQFSASIKTVIDAYCGSGFFTEKFLSRFNPVIAIEKDPRLIKDLQRLSQKNLEIIEGDVLENLGAILENAHAAQTGLLVDPPREGLNPLVLQDITTHPPAEFVYVSCNPATLARDAKNLLAKFDLVSIQPVDLFPRTAQIECVSTWRYRPGA